MQCNVTHHRTPHCTAPNLMLVPWPLSVEATPPPPPCRCQDGACTFCPSPVKRAPQCIHPPDPPAGVTACGCRHAPDLSGACTFCPPERLMPRSPSSVESLNRRQDRAKSLTRVCGTSACSEEQN